MDHFQYQDGRLYGEGVDLTALCDQVGTPVYVYSRQTLLDHYQSLSRAFAPLDPLICYSIKSCGNVHILRLLAEAGAGMDIVSGGELHRARKAGADPEKIVYAGVGKTDAEIRAALDAGIGYFNIESENEFETIAALARQAGATAHAALRVNPDVYDPDTHAKTTTGRKETKFGVDIDRAAAFFARYGKDEHLRLDALHLHIGSPIYSADAYAQAIEKALGLIDQLRASGFAIAALNIGGGYGADYTTDQTPPYTLYAERIVPLLRPFVEGGGKVILEPGRTIAANAGVLLSRVLYTKTGGTRRFVIVDTGMHHLVRPAMYDAFHFMWPTVVAADFVPSQRGLEMNLAGLETVDVVGPICETGDILASQRALPPMQRGEVLATFTAGAYGMVMASNYNAMPRPAEVLLNGDQWTTIRRRETYDDLTALEE